MISSKFVTQTVRDFDSICLLWSFGNPAVFSWAGSQDSGRCCPGRVSGAELSNRASPRRRWAAIRIARLRPPPPRPHANYVGRGYDCSPDIANANGPT